MAVFFTAKMLVYLSDRLSSIGEYIFQVLFLIQTSSNIKWHQLYHDIYTKQKLAKLDVCEKKICSVLSHHCMICAQRKVACDMCVVSDMQWTRFACRDAGID